MELFIVEESMSVLKSLSVDIKLESRIILDGSIVELGTLRGTLEEYENFDSPDGVVNHINPDTGCLRFKGVLVAVAFAVGLVNIDTGVVDVASVIVGVAVVVVVLASVVVIVVSNVVVSAAVVVLAAIIVPAVVVILAVVASAAFIAASVVVDVVFAVVVVVVSVGVWVCFLDERKVSFLGLDLLFWRRFKKCLE